MILFRMNHIITLERVQVHIQKPAIAKIRIHAPNELQNVIETDIRQFLENHHPQGLCTLQVAKTIQLYLQSWVGMYRWFDLLIKYLLEQKTYSVHISGQWFKYNSVFHSGVYTAPKKKKEEDLFLNNKQSNHTSFSV